MKPKLTVGVHKIMVSIPSISDKRPAFDALWHRGRSVATGGMLCAILIVMVVPTHASTTTTTTTTEGAENPYKAIPVRNAFGIRPPPPPAPPPPPPIQTPAAPPSNVSLTGFAVVRGVKKVYLQVTTPGKLPVYIDLEENEMREDIKVVEINAKKEYAKILNSGQEVTLNFKENGLKTAAPAPARAQVPGRPGANPQNQQRQPQQQQQQQRGGENQRGRQPAAAAPTPTVIGGRGGTFQGGIQQSTVGASNDGRRMAGRNFNNVTADPALFQGQMPPTPTPIRGNVVPTPPPPGR